MVDCYVKQILSLYDGFFARMFVYLRCILLPPDKVERFVPVRGRIVDVGCGYGHYAIYFALKQPKRIVRGYEFNKNRVRAANKAAARIDNVDFFCRDIRRDSSLKSCDCICLIDLLHHVPREAQDNLLLECSKKLAKEGVLIVKDVDNRPLWKYVYNYVHDKIFTLNDKLYFSSRKQMETKLEGLGFKITFKETIRTWFLNPIPHYILILKNRENNV